jgi:hydrogenase maturation factor
VPASPAAERECSDHCVTCSDEALPLRVVEARPGALALCEADVEVMTDLVGPVEVGDVLLVHAGVALARVDT